MFCLKKQGNTWSAGRVHYQEHLVDIEEFMVDRKLSKKLQSHVISYLANLWEKHK